MKRKQPGIASASPTVSEGLILPKRRQSSLERVLGAVDLLVDDPEGDLLFLGSSEGRNSDLNGDHDGADPLCFDQSYLGPQIAFLSSLAALLFCASCFLCCVKILVYISDILQWILTSLLLCCDS